MARVRKACYVCQGLIYNMGKMLLEIVSVETIHVIPPEFVICAADHRPFLPQFPAPQRQHSQMTHPRYLVFSSPSVPPKHMSTQSLPQAGVLSQHC